MRYNSSGNVQIGTAHILLGLLLLRLDRCGRYLGLGLWLLVILLRLLLHLRAKPCASTILGRRKKV